MKDIPNCPGYCARPDGSIWSCWKPHRLGYGSGSEHVVSSEWRQLKPDKRIEDGRKRHTVKTTTGSYRRTYASIFVLETFVGPCPEGMECCHNDGNCLNDSIGNLRWDTSTANKADMAKHGTRLIGEQMGLAKLTDGDVREIRRIGLPLKQHAVRYGVSKTLISMVLKRKIWKHV